MKMHCHSSLSVTECLVLSFWLPYYFYVSLSNINRFRCLSGLVFRMCTTSLKKLNDLSGIESMTLGSVRVDPTGFWNTIFHSLHFRMCSIHSYGWGPLSIELSSIPTLYLETLTRRYSLMSFCKAASNISGCIWYPNRPANLNALNILKGSSLNVT